MLINMWKLCKTLYINAFETIQVETIFLQPMNITENNNYYSFYVKHNFHLWSGP